MAIKKVVETTTSELKPYLGEFIKTLGKKEVKKLLESYHGIQQASKTKSGKGWILTGEEFSVFIWSKSKSENALLECLDDSSYGYPMVEVKDDEGNFNLVFDDEIQFSIQNNDNKFLFFPLSNSSNADTEKESITEPF